MSTNHRKLTKICLKCSEEHPLTSFDRDGVRFRAICQNCTGDVTTAFDGGGRPRIASKKKFDLADKAKKRSVIVAHQSLKPAQGEVTLAIGDLHAPFWHPDTVAFLAAAKAKYQPTKIVFLGDEIDSHACSDWTADPDGMSAGDELTSAIEMLQDLYELFPSAMICESNHTFRVHKKAFKNGIPSTWIRHIRDVLQAPETWHWAERWIVDGVQFVHGESFGGQSGAYRTAMMSHRSTVIGHIHSFAGILYSSMAPGDNLFGLNVGCLIDERGYSFAYAKHMKSRPWIGVGLIERGIPHLIPMKMDDSKRWTGEL